MRPRVQLTGDLERFFELSPDLCCVMALDGTVQASNAAWFGLLGYGALDVESHRFTDFVHPDERERVAHAMIDHERSMLAARMQHKDGSYRRVRWWVMAALENQRIYAIGRDEASGLANVERMLSLGQIALGIVHDLKNVLVHPLTLHLHRVERAVETQSKEKARSAIKAMRLALDDGVTAIDRMLRFTQPAAKSTRTKVDVENLVWRATEIARAYARGLTSSTEIALAYEQGKPKKLECDAFELLASLVNVMFNAIDAVADKGGTVSVRTGVSAKRVWMEIVDDGPGMSDEVRARLFEPFFTTKTGGVGIGLAMVKSCIESHNGTIAIDSNPTGGTTFRIELPMG